MKFWKTVFFSAAAVLAAVLIAWLLGVLASSLRRNTELSRKVAALEAEIRARDDAIGELRAKQDLFRNDPRFVESLAREKIGKAKQGETIFKFPDRETPLDE